MSATIDSIIGWDSGKHRVIAKGIDNELYAGDPNLQAEIANDPYLTNEPALYAKRAFIHAMINHRDWSWRHFQVEHAFLYEDEIRAKTKAKIGF